MQLPVKLPNSDMNQNYMFSIRAFCTSLVGWIFQFLFCYSPNLFFFDPFDVQKFGPGRIIYGFFVGCQDPQTSRLSTFLLLWISCSLLRHRKSMWYVFISQVWSFQIIYDSLLYNLWAVPGFKKFLLVAKWNHFDKKELLSQLFFFTVLWLGH